MSKVRRRVNTSIVIPCYNEEENIEKMLAGFSAALRDDFFGIEIIFVNNGSTDRTGELLQKKIADHKFAKAIHLAHNFGYGHGILAGLNNADGSLVGYMHGDMQVLPASVIEIARSLSSIKINAPLFFKARRYGRSFFEVVFTLCMTLFCSFLFKFWLADINAQPTFFRKNLLEDLTEIPGDFSFDLFLFLIAKKRGIQLIRKPVRVHKRIGGISSWNHGIISKFVLSWSFVKAALSIRKTFRITSSKHQVQKI